jgi:hypothetical protein
MSTSDACETQQCDRKDFQQKKQILESGILKAESMDIQQHFRSLSREELAETDEEAGFLTNGSSPGISPSPFISATSGGHFRAAWPQMPAFRLQWRDRVGIAPTSLLPLLGHLDSFFRDQIKRVTYTTRLRSLSKKSAV